MPLVLAAAIERAPYVSSAIELKWEGKTFKYWSHISQVYVGTSVCGPKWSVWCRNPLHSWRVKCKINLVRVAQVDENIVKGKWLINYEEFFTNDLKYFDSLF